MVRFFYLKRQYKKAKETTNNKIDYKLEKNVKNLVKKQP